MTSALVDNQIQGNFVVAWKVCNDSLRRLACNL